LGLDSLNLHAAWLNDSLSYSLSWNDMLHTEMNAGHISGFVELSAPGRFEAGIRNASAIVNGNKWSIGKGNHLVIDTTFITVTDLVFNGPGQEFRVDGTLSKKYSDTLSVDFKNWQLSNFDPLIGDESLVVHGTINGRLNLSNYVSPRIFADLDIAGLVFAGTGLGDMQINTHWNNQDNALLIDAKLFGEGSRDVSKVLDIQGYYYPFNKTSNFDVNIRAMNMKLAPAGPFLSVFMSGLKGLASGDLHLGGTWKKLELTGQLHLQRTEFVIDYLKTKYSLSHDIFFEKSRIYFHDLVLYDTLNNKAICNGELTHNYFRDLALDLDIRPEKILAVNLDRYQNSIFYGKAFATGEVRITGPLDDIDLQVSATTNSGTKIFIPINYSVDLSQSDFIIFKNLADTLTKPEEYKTVVKGLNLNFDLNVTRDAEIQLFLPGNMGFIRASGEGGLFMGIDPRGYFTIYGSYAIRSGQFQFSLQSLISKRFDITEGSRIKWSGDIYDAEVNITAKYKLKTTLSGLGITMIDEQATSQKVNVNCIIRMTGNLFNPDLGFSIEFPSLNEQTKQAVYAILDTNDAALMNQQAISLLVLNSFSTAGTTVGSPITSTSVLTNTLSSWLSQISNDFDVGINYVPGDAVSQEEVGVALSTQLFDERLTIDGNLDVSNSKSTQKSSSIVGDVNIEYRLTTDGRFRVKAFNRANNVSILQESSPYTQGVGVFYRKEFDNFKDFFKKKKKIAPVEP
jgi:hypothetical protein